MDDDTAADEERAIREVVETLLEATRSSDGSTVLDLMTDDVVFVVPDREPLEVEVLGDHAFIRNHIETTTTPPDGDPVRHSGHTLSILRKGSDGRWRLARDANLVTPDE